MMRAFEYSPHRPCRVARILGTELYRGKRCTEAHAAQCFTSVRIASNSRSLGDARTTPRKSVSAPHESHTERSYGKCDLNQSSSGWRAEIASADERLR